VIVDDKLVFNKGAKGQRVPSYVSRSPEELSKIRGLVVAAVGFNQERGDQVTVENLPFQMLELPTEEPPPSAMKNYWTMIQPVTRYAGVALVILFAYLLLLRPLKRRVLESLRFEVLPDVHQLPESSAVSPQHSLPSGAMRSLPGEQSSYVRKLSEVEKELDAQIEDELAVASLNADAKKAAAIKKRIVEMAKQQPEQTAQLIRSWLSNSSFQ
jgi:flagellar M-ring protein FliF